MFACADFRGMKTKAVFPNVAIATGALLGSAQFLQCPVVRAQEASVSPATSAANTSAVQDATETPADDAARAARGIALYVSGGIGALAPVSAGGGLSGALTYEFGNWGFGGFATVAAGAAAAGKPNEDAEPGKPADAAMVWGYGALLNYAGRGSVAPIFSLGFGKGGLSVLRGETLDRYESTGALTMVRGGALWESGSFVTLNANVPLFSARHKEGLDDKEFALSVIAEYGVRFGR